MAISDSGVLVREIHMPPGLNSSSRILPAIQEMCRTFAPEYLTLTVGPGSYTGMRVGAAVAKMIAFSRNLPVVCLSSLQGFYIDEPHTALIDAKISGAYLLIDNEPKALALEDLCPHLKEVIVTPNHKRLEPKFNALFPDKKLLWKESNPSASRLALLGYEKYIQGDLSSPNHLSLLYLRKTQAEMELSEKRGGVLA